MSDLMYPAAPAAEKVDLGLGEWKAAHKNMRSAIC